MEQGWIKLHRELMDKSIWLLSTPEQKVILITILMMVNHEDREWEWQGKRFVCRAGQVVTSLASIAELAGNEITVKKVRTAIARFEKYGFLANQATKTGRLITICNWERYQDSETSEGKALGNAQAKHGQLTRMIKNDKNIKKEINKEKKQFSQEDYDSDKEYFG